jgi:hypothetical protein
MRHGSQPRRKGIGRPTITDDQWGTLNIIPRLAANGVVLSLTFLQTFDRWHFQMLQYVPGASPQGLPAVDEPSIA